MYGCRLEGSDITERREYNTVKRRVNGEGDGLGVRRTFVIMALILIILNMFVLTDETLRAAAGAGAICCLVMVLIVSITSCSRGGIAS